MNEKEIAELRRRFRPEKSCISRIRGGCINEKKELVSEFDQPLGMLPEQEAEELLRQARPHADGHRILDAAGVGLGRAPVADDPARHGAQRRGGGT